MKPYISTESHIERANSRALSPVPFAAEPKDAPSMRYTGFFIGTSCRRQKINCFAMENRTCDEEIQISCFRRWFPLTRNYTRIILFMISWIVVFIINTSFLCSAEKATFSKNIVTHNHIAASGSRDNKCQYHLTLQLYLALWRILCLEGEMCFSYPHNQCNSVVINNIKW